TVVQVIQEEPVPPSRLAPRVPRDLEVICLMCLNKEPRRRYGSAEALAEDLERFLAGEPIQARPVSLTERAIKWARRRPAVAALLAVLAVVVAGAVAGLAELWLLAEDARVDALDRYRTSRRHLYVANMALAQAAWNDGHTGRLRELLGGLEQRRP